MRAHEEEAGAFEDGLPCEVTEPHGIAGDGRRGMERREKGDQGERRGRPTGREEKKKRKKEKKKREPESGTEAYGVNCPLSSICHLGLTVGQVGQKTC